MNTIPQIFYIQKHLFLVAAALQGLQASLSPHHTPAVLLRRLGGMLQWFPDGNF